MLYAHYFGPAKGWKTLYITTGLSIRGGVVEIINVHNKREANKIAKERGANPCNF